MTPEHKAKMAIGRERAKQERLARKEKVAIRMETRGRPAAIEAIERPMPREIPTEMTPEERAIQDIIDSGGEGLTRQSMQAGADFDIPLRGRVPGWVYCYWPTKIMGQEVDPSTMVEYRRGGWLPVPASHFPQLRAPGSQATTIDRHGQRMFMRPERLNKEAEAEQQKLAYEQKASRLAAAQAGDAGREFARRVNADGTPAARIDVDVKPLI